MDFTATSVVHTSYYAFCYILSYMHSYKISIAEFLDAQGASMGGWRAERRHIGTTGIRLRA